MQIAVVRIDDGYISADIRKGLWMAADMPEGFSRCPDFAFHLCCHIAALIRHDGQLTFMLFVIAFSSSLLATRDFH